MPISFHNADIKFSLTNRTALKKFIEKQIRQSPNFRISKFPNLPINLSFVFCSDEYLLNINRQFLNHDYYTDIITFPLSDDDTRLDAEIYISVERVAENAEKFEVRRPMSEVKGKSNRPSSLLLRPYLLELHRVMFHGVLHLLGYKDKTKMQKLEMRKMEDAWLGRFKKQNSKQ